MKTRQWIPILSVLILTAALLFGALLKAQNDQKAAANPSGAAQLQQAQQSANLSRDFGTNLPVFKYDPGGKRDPFMPYRIFTAKSKKDDGSGIPMLQRFELDRYEVVGVMWDISKPRAMVKDPDGGVHMVYVNSKIGRNRGIITEIREGQLLVTEKIDIEGGMKDEFHVLDIRK